MNPQSMRRHIARAKTENVRRLARYLKIPMRSRMRTRELRAAVADVVTTVDYWGGGMYS